MTQKTMLCAALSGLLLFGWGCRKDAAPQIQQPASSGLHAATATQNQPSGTGTPAAKIEDGGTAPAKPPKAPSNSPTTKNPPTQQETNANQLAPATAYVTIKDGAFSPQVVSIKAGGKVVWTNKDTVPHTTRSDGTLLWDSGTIKTDASYSHAFKATGAYPYSCGIHSSMKGTVYVY